MAAPNRTLDKRRIEQFLLLRVLVGFLGEKDQFAWWDTSFLSTVGCKYLGITFPRSGIAAGVVAVTEAACRLHDSRIGQGRVCHLFRLPQVTEQRIHQGVLTGDAAGLLKVISSREAAFQELESLAKEPESLPDGPVKLGNASGLSTPAAVAKLAGIYFGAFRAGRQCLPYFTAGD